MAKRATCPRKGSIYIVNGTNPVIATGGCKGAHVEVATLNSGIVALTKANLKVTRGKKREAARQVLAASNNAITAWLASKGAKPGKTPKARTRAAKGPSGSWSKQFEQFWAAQSSGPQVTRDSTTSVAVDPMDEYAMASRRGALPSDWRSRESFEGLSGRDTPKSITNWKGEHFRVGEAIHAIINGVVVRGTVTDLLPDNEAFIYARTPGGIMGPARVHADDLSHMGGA